MLTLLGRSFGNVIAVKASGKLTHEDYQQLLPKLEKLIQEHGKLCMLFELDDCQGWEVGAAWDDLKFDMKHHGDFERCAVVGEKRWQKWMTKLSKPFFKAKYFDKSELEKAWQWVQEAGEEAIRKRAYLKWEAAGKPPGDGNAFWLQAEQEILQEK